jgi:hypothetical protein
MVGQNALNLFSPTVLPEPLCQQWVEVNEKNCHLRPVQAVKDEKELEALKKNCTSGRGSVDMSSAAAVNLL